MSCRCGKKKTGMQTEATSSSHGTSPSSSSNWETLWRRASNCGKASCTKHSQAYRVRNAEKPPTESTIWTSLGQSRAAQLASSKKHCQSNQDVDRELGEDVCFAVMVEKFGFSYDTKGATQRANVYAGKTDGQLKSLQSQFRGVLLVSSQGSQSRSGSTSAAGRSEGRSWHRKPSKFE